VHFLAIGIVSMIDLFYACSINDIFRSDRHVWVRMAWEKSRHIHSLPIKMIGLGKRYEKVRSCYSLRIVRYVYEQYFCLASVPIVPPLTNDEDTSNFDEIEKTDGPSEESFSVSKTFLGNQLSFVGFSYSNEQQ
jgi:hypothetical protein